MKKLTNLLFVLLFWQCGFSQKYKYEFAINEVVEVDQAKEAIGVIRDLMGVKTILFDDDTDRFSVYTHLNMEPLEMVAKFEGNGIDIVGGEISKVNVE